MKKKVFKSPKVITSGKANFAGGCPKCGTSSCGIGYRAY